MQTGPFFFLPPHLFSLKTDFRYTVVLKSLESKSSEKEETEFYSKPQGKDFFKKQKENQYKCSACCLKI